MKRGRLLLLIVLAATVLSGCRALRVNIHAVHPVAGDTFQGSSWVGTGLIGAPVCLLLLPITYPIALATAESDEERLGILGAPWVVGIPFGYLLGGVITTPVLVGTLPFAPDDEELLRMLREAGPNDQRYAAAALAELQVQEAIVEMEDTLLFGAEPGVEIACLEGLGKLLPADEVPQMLVNRLSALYPETRIAAVDELCDRRERQAVVALIRVLDEIQPQPVRSAAYQALRTITGQKRLTPELDGWIAWWPEAQPDYPPQLLPEELRDTPRWPPEAFE